MRFYARDENKEMVILSKAHRGSAVRTYCGLIISTRGYPICMYNGSDAG